MFLRFHVTWQKLSVSTPTHGTSWQLLKGILYRFLTHCASPRGHLRAKSKKIERSNHLKTTLTHHKILPDSALRQICGCVEKMACRIHKADYLEKGEHRGKRLGQIKWLPSGVGIACHPTSQMCQWGPSCTRSQPSVASDVSRESSSWGIWSTSVIAIKIILQENRSVEIVQAQLQTGNRKPK